MTSPSPASDEILLRFPARSPFGRLARVGAASLALRQSMSFREIDDLRLAVDEAMVLLSERVESGVGADVIVTYRLGEGSLEVEMRRSDEAALDPAAVDRFDRLTSPLVDDLDVDAGRGWLRIVLLHHLDESVI